jgi:hypothetical protein
MVVVNWVILIAGIVGLGVAGYALVSLTAGARRRHSYADIGLALAVAVATVVLLIAFGDRILR